MAASPAVLAAGPASTAGVSVLARLLTGLGALIVMVLFTALIAPYFIDWTAYKREFEVQASRIFGQPVTVGGEAQVRILPLPSLAFGGLSIGRNGDGTPMMTVNRLSAHVELLPFLKGQIRVVDMTLDRPSIDIRVGEDGRVAWTSRQELLLDPEMVKLEKLTIREGSVTIAGLADGRTLSASGMEAEVSARSLVGPWTISGRGLVEGVPSRFDISTGHLQEDGTVRFKISVEREDQPYRLALDGPVGIEKDVLTWNGSFEISPVAGGPAGKPLPVRAKGLFRLQPTGTMVPEYRLEIGADDDPFTLTGEGSARFSNGVQFHLAVDGRQVDFDRIARMQGKEAEGGQTLEERIAILRNVIDRIPVPGVDGEIDMEIPAIVAGDTLIREVSGLIKPDMDGWSVRRFTATLPGNTALEARGRLALGEDFGFSGHLVVASRQPSGFAAWAAGKVEPAIRRLSAMGFEADVTLTASQLGFDNLELVLGDNRLTGSVRRVAPAGGQANAPAAVIAVISGDKVLLDDLSAVSSMLMGGDGMKTSDFDVSLKARRLEGMGLAADDLDVQFRQSGGELSIRSLNAGDFLGARISSKGQIGDLFNRPSGNLEIAVEAGDATRIAALAIERLGSNPVLEALASDAELTGGADLSLMIEARPDGDGSKARMVANGVIGGTRLSFRGGLTGRISDPERLRTDYTANFVNPDASVLIRQAGGATLGFNPLIADLGAPLSMSVEGSGGGAEGHHAVLSATLGGTNLSADGKITGLPGDAPGFSFDVTAGSSDIVPLANAFSVVLPGFDTVLGETRPFSLTGRVEGDAQSQRAVIERAQIGGNPVSGTLNRLLPPGQVPRYEGEIKVGTLSLPFLAGTGFGDVSAGIGGAPGEWADGEFSGSLLAGIDGAFAIEADRLVTGLGEDGEAARARISVSNGDLTINELEASWLGGRLVGSGLLASASGTGRLQAQYRIEGAALESLGGALAIAPVASGSISFSGSMEGTGKSARAVAGSLTGSGVYSTRDLRISGISTTGLAGVLEAADAEGFQIAPDTVQPLIRKGFLGGGAIEAGDLSGAFTINGGTIQLRNAGFRVGGNAVSIDGAYSLLSHEADATLTMTVDAGKDRVSGAEPEFTLHFSGDASAPESLVDSQGLEGYLSIRAFEAEQRRVELLESSILEKQRLRHDVIRTNLSERKREEARREEQRRIEEERKAREEEARRKAEEEAAARKAAEEAAARKAAEEAAARKAAEEAAARRAAEEATAKKAADEAAARKAAEKAAAKKAADEAAARKAAEDAAPVSNGGQALQGKPGAPLQLGLPGSGPDTAPGAAGGHSGNTKQTGRQTGTSPKPQKKGFVIETLPVPEPGKPAGLLDSIEQLLFKPKF